MTTPHLPAMDPDNRFGGLPVATEYIDGDTWRLTRAVTYVIREGVHAGKTLTVRAGFLFDWASTPSIMWFLLPPAGKKGNPYGIAALIHDWLYAHKAVSGKPITRAEADAIFNEICRYVGCHRWLAGTMWAGVRLGGWLPWRLGKTDDSGLQIEDSSPKSESANLQSSIFNPQSAPTLQDASGIGLLDCKPQGGAEGPATILQKSSDVLQKVSETTPQQEDTP